MFKINNASTVNKWEIRWKLTKFARMVLMRLFWCLYYTWGLFYTVPVFLLLILNSNFLLITLFCYKKTSLSFCLKINRSSHQRYSARKGVLRNFTKFTEKHLCQRLFFNEVVNIRYWCCKYQILMKACNWILCFHSLRLRHFRCYFVSLFLTLPDFSGGWQRTHHLSSYHIVLLELIWE